MSSDFMRPPTAELLHKLETIAELGDRDRKAILGLRARQRWIRAGEDFVREGDRPDASVLLVKGWVCRHKMTDDGRRQIVSFHLPGDMPDLQSLLLTEMDHSLCAVTDVYVSYIGHDVLRTVIREHPTIGEALWREMTIDASCYREWLLNVGRRSAPVRMAHLFCELYARLAALDLADDGEYAFPITQSVLADALGLSPVHVNRSLQELRSEGLLSWAHGRLVIHRLADLRAFAGFRPNYLHQLAA